MLDVSLQLITCKLCSALGQKEQNIEQQTLDLVCFIFELVKGNCQRR
jgi:hypothetical protein